MTELNRMIDLIDGFIAADSFEDRWAVAHESVLSIGGTDVNTAEIDGHSGNLKWVASTMSQSWMERYLARGYYDSDALILHTRNSYDLRTFSYGEKYTPNIPPHLGMQMELDLVDLGYAGAIAQSNTIDKGRSLFVSSLLADRSFMKLGGDRVAKQFARTAATISAFLGTPQDDTVSNVYFSDYRALSPRQKDVLSLVAAGHQYAAISERLGISEHTVRLHVKSACEKLGAATREHAIAIAIRDHLIQI